MNVTNMYLCIYLKWAEIDSDVYEAYVFIWIIYDINITCAIL